MLIVKAITISLYLASDNWAFFLKGALHRLQDKFMICVFITPLLFAPCGDVFSDNGISHQGFYKRTSRMPLLASVEGCVTDFFGNPIPDVSIEILNSRSKKEYTDKKGRFNLVGLPKGKSTLLFKAVGFYPETQEIDIDNEERTYLNVGLRLGYMTPAPSLDISGLIRSKTFIPIEEAKVVLINAYNSNYSKIAYSDKKGKFIIKLNDPGIYIVIISKPEYIPTSITINTSANRQIDTILEVKDFK